MSTEDPYAGEVPDCGCTDEYGPCEQHGEVKFQREGASARTADELALQFIDDALALDSECLSAEGRDTRRKAVADLAAEREGFFGGWLSDADLSQALNDLVDQVENYIGPEYQTYRDDGYRIVRITGGPLKEDV